MDKKSYIQISITILILLIITFVYFDYFKSPRENLSKKTEDSSAKKLVKNSEDLISEMINENRTRRSELISTLTYPLILFVSMLSLLYFILEFALPRMLNVMDLSSNMPFPTTVLIISGNFLPIIIVTFFYSILFFFY